jgi:hypothetical protein
LYRVSLSQNECAAIEKQLKDKIEYFKVVDQEKAREKELEEEFKRKREVLFVINILALRYCAKQTVGGGETHAGFLQIT